MAGYIFALPSHLKSLILHIIQKYFADFHNIFGRLLIILCFVLGWNLCFNTEGLEKLNGVPGKLLLTYFSLLVFFFSFYSLLSISLSLSLTLSLFPSLSLCLSYYFLLYLSIQGKKNIRKRQMPKFRFREFSISRGSELLI